MIKESNVFIRSTKCPLIIISPEYKHPKMRLEISMSPGLIFGL